MRPQRDRCGRSFSGSACDRHLAVTFDADAFTDISNTLMRDILRPQRGDIESDTVIDDSDLGAAV